MIGVAPFVGREAEQSALHELLNRARSSAGGVVVLTGSAGIGKTRLADEVATGAAGEFLVLAATCGPADTMPPFWPWRQLLADLLRRDDDLRNRTERQWPAALRLADFRLAGHASGAGTDHASARAELYDDVVSLLAAAAAGRPLLLVLDDLQNGDPSSLLLLAHLAPRLRSMPVVVLATWRTGEVRLPEPADAAFLRQVRVIAVPPLDVAEVGSLLASVAGQAVDPAVTAAVHRRTSGNPLLAQEVIVNLRAGGGQGGVDTVNAVVPESIRALVGERVRSVPPETATALAVAAALGAAFPLEVMGEALGLEVLDVLEALGPAVGAGVLQSLGPTEGTFTHDLMRDVVGELSSPAARARLHAQLARSFERLQAAGRAVEPVDLARHFLAAGPAYASEALRYAAEAGRRAMALLAYEEAARWFAHALAVANGGASDAEGRAGVLLALGEAQEAKGDRAGARRTYLGAAAAARAAGRADFLASAALGMSGTIGFEVTMLDHDQIDLLREALAVLAPDDLARRASVMARLAVAVSFLEDVEQRARLSEEAVALARASGDPFALVQALAARCDAISGPEHARARQQMAAEIVEIGTRLREPLLELLGRRLAVVARLELGDVEGADREIRSFSTRAAALRRPVYGWYVPLWQSMRALMDGRIDEASAALAAAEQVAGESDSENAAMLTTTLRWHVLGELGRVEELGEMVATVGLENFPGVWPLVSRALCAAQLGQRGPATALLDTAAARLPEAERDSEWLPMVCQVSEVIAVTGPHPVASWAYSSLLPFRSYLAVEGIGAAVRGPVERALGVLAAALGRREEAAAHFDAALDAAETIGAGLIAARTLRDAGVALGDTARLDEARRRYRALGLERRVAELDELLASKEAGGDAPREVDNVFRREGEVWRLVHAGREVRLRDSKGLRDLGRMVADPGRPFPAVELAAGVGTARRDRVEDGLSAPGDLGELVDARARAAYRRRLAELDEEIDDADRAADIGRSARAGAEKEALVAQLTAAYGLGGRPRRTGDPAERSRQTVTARIRDALNRIEAAHPELGRHLRRSVRTGRICLYEPDSPITWSV